MSLTRTALRLAVVEALAPTARYATGGPWPTLACGRVVDSQVPPEAETAADEKTPVIAVYTETSKTSDGAGSLFDLSAGHVDTCTLALEIIVPSFALDDEGNPVTYAAPTDAVAEAMLDLIEAQILRRLLEDASSGALALIGAVFMAAQSEPWRDADIGVRLAARRIEFEVRLPYRTAWREAGLPAPFADLSAALPADGYGRAVINTLAALAGSATAFDEIETMRLAANLTRAPGDTPPAPPDATTTPPDSDLGGSVTF